MGLRPRARFARAWSSAKKIHRIRKCRDKKSRLKQTKVMKRAKPQVIREVRIGFHVIMDDLLLSEVQITEKNREQTKKIQWDYIGKYTSEKRNELLTENIGEKKKK